MRKNKQWDKPNRRPNPKVDYRPDGTKQTSWKMEYGDKKMIVLLLVVASFAKGRISCEITLNLDLWHLSRRLNRRLPMANMWLLVTWVHCNFSMP